MNSFDPMAQKAKLDALRNKFTSKQTQPTNSTQKALFRPKMDEPQIVRIVPDKDGDFFKELMFYYNTGIKGERGYDISILSPESYGELDRIKVVAEGLENDDTEENRKIPQELKNSLLKKLKRTTKYTISVVVRGQEDQGVKYWSASETAFKNLLDNIEKNGHLIYDPENGCDIKIWNSLDTSNPERKYTKTNFLFGKTSPLSEFDELRDSLRNNQPDLLSQYTKHTDQEIQEILTKIVSPYFPDTIPTEEEANKSTGTDYTAVHKAASEVPQQPVSEPAQEQVTEEDHFNDLPF